VRSMPIIVDDDANQFTAHKLPTLEELIAFEDEASQSVVLPPIPQPEEVAIGQAPELAWEMPEEEGQLAIDVYENAEQVIVMSAIAGVRSNEIELVLQQDMLTIRGNRQAPVVDGDSQSLVQECYWGRFSRTIILPGAIDPRSVQAKLSSGILTVTLNKLSIPDTIPIIETDEEYSEEPEA